MIFVDTNILLDFYRVRGREAGLSILKHIDDNLDRFIITNQVEMEFKKNRQRVILDTDKVFKMPKWEGLQLPGFLAESKQSTALSKSRRQRGGQPGHPGHWRALVPADRVNETVHVQATQYRHCQHRLHRATTWASRAGIR